MATMSDLSEGVSVTGGVHQGTAQATTSGTVKTFSGIPSGVTHIIISFEGVSLDGSQSYEVRLGDAGGIEATGYISSSFTVDATGTTAGSDTTGFMMRGGTAADIMSGHMILTLIDAATFTWVSSHTAKMATTDIIFGGGDKSLSAELTQLTIQDGGSDSFDLGKVNIMYW